MRASELIVQVHEREYTRLLTWAQSYMGNQEAADLCRYAIVAMWTHSALGENTRHGAVEYMQASLLPRIRRLREVRGSYLPVAAPLTVVLPSDTELNELADAYSLVQVTAMHYEMDWTLRCDVQAWLHDRLDVSGLPRYDRHVFRRADAGGEFVKAAGAALDAGVPVTADRYGYRDACRRRELDRSRRWLITVTAQKRGAGHGQVQQVRDRSLPGEDESDHQVEGSRETRDTPAGLD